MYYGLEFNWQRKFAQVTTEVRLRTEPHGQPDPAAKFEVLFLAATSRTLPPLVWHARVSLDQPNMSGRRKTSLTILGHNVKNVPKKPNLAKLETFKNQYSGRNYEISIDCPDFTSLCPVTGQPDFAQIVIVYVPDKLCVETKSLKLYLNAFRNEPSFNEEIVNRVLDDLVAAVSPRSMTVVGEFAPRGGISLKITAQHPQSEN